jgi:hypothetical protein
MWRLRQLLRRERRKMRATKEKAHGRRSRHMSATKEKAMGGGAVT